ncbi:MAG: hypothetical protein FWD86_00550 [Firmicutes bacterium]|nr:hypothetical protein [Bacillota bacterium]
MKIRVLEKIIVFLLMACLVGASFFALNLYVFRQDDGGFEFDYSVLLNRPGRNPSDGGGGNGGDNGDGGGGGAGDCDDKYDQKLPKGKFPFVYGFKNVDNFSSGDIVSFRQFDNYFYFENNLSKHFLSDGTVDGTIEIEQTHLLKLQSAFVQNSQIKYDKFVFDVSGLVGLSDVFGNVLINPQYKVIDFNKNTAIAVDTNGINHVYFKGQHKGSTHFDIFLYNRDGFVEYVPPSAVDYKIFDIKDGFLFDNNVTIDDLLTDFYVKNDTNSQPISHIVQSMPDITSGIFLIMCKNGLFGYASIKIGIIYQPQFSTAQPFKNNSAFVSVGGKRYHLKYVGYGKVIKTEVVNQMLLRARVGTFFDGFAVFYCTQASAYGVVKKSPIFCCDGADCGELDGQTDGGGAAECEGMVVAAFRFEIVAQPTFSGLHNRVFGTDDCSDGRFVFCVVTNFFFSLDSDALNPNRLSYSSVLFFDDFFIGEFYCSDKNQTLFNIISNTLDVTGDNQRLGVVKIFLDEECEGVYSFNHAAHLIQSNTLIIFNQDSLYFFAANDNMTD